MVFTFFWAFTPIYVYTPKSVKTLQGLSGKLERNTRKILIKNFGKAGKGYTRTVG